MSTLALETGTPGVSGCAERLTLAVLGTLDNRFRKPETQHPKDVQVHLSSKR